MSMSMAATIGSSHGCNRISDRFGEVVETVEDSALTHGPPRLDNCLKRNDRTIQVIQSGTMVRRPASR